MKEIIQKKVISLLNRKFVQDTIWLSVARIIEVISAFVINIIVAKGFGNSGIGIFNQVFAFYMIYTVVLNLGLSNSVLKFCAEDRSMAYKVYQQHKFITILISVPLSLIIFIVTISFPAIFSNFEVAKASMLSVLSLPLFLINKNALSYLNAIRELKSLSIIRVVRWVSNLIVMCLIISFSRKFEHIFLSFLVTELFMYIYIKIILEKNNSFCKEKKIEKKYFIFGSQSFLAEIIATLNDKFGIIVLGYFLSKNDIGVYSLLITIASSLFYIQQVISQNINPIVANLYYENKIEELQLKINKVTKISFLLTLTITLLLIPAFMILSNFILKDQLNSFFPLFLFMVFASCILAPFYWSGGMLIMGSFVKQNLYRTLIIFIINIISLSVCSFYFKLIGAAFALLIINIITVVIQNVAIKKYMNIRLLPI